MRLAGNNTIATFKCTAPGQAFLITAGSTNTVTTFTVDGTADARISFDTLNDATYTFSKASGTVTANFLALNSCVAQGGAVWNTSNSVDGGANTGWNFISPYRIPSPLFEFAA